MSNDNQLLLLFDGHALIHRAFHAIPPLTVSKTGEPTGAVYGFASMLLRVLAEYKPTHCAVAFDSPGPTFRHEKYIEYKAHRPPAPDELKQQFARVRQLVQAFNIKSFEVPGFEADDILGTIATKAGQKSINTMIVTGDTDTFQLVTSHTRVVVPRPGKSFNDTVVYDEDGIKNRYGLKPEQLIDLKGLKGDPSDNIPGIPGIGDKTATKLLQQFETIEGIYDHIDEVIPERIQKILKENETKARQSKELATIITDMPLEFEITQCCLSTYERLQVADLFRELEFASLLPKLPNVMASGQQLTLSNVESVCKTTYLIVDTSSALDELVHVLSQSKQFAFDTETSEQDPRRASLTGISFAIEPGKAWYIPVGHSTGNQLSLQEVMSKLKPILEDSGITKLAHNGKFDMTVLLKYDIQVQNLGFDTMLAAHLLGEKAIGLKTLTFSKLGLEMVPITDLIGTGSKQICIGWVDIPRVANYACADADMTWRLYELFNEELTNQGLKDAFTEVEVPLQAVLVKMETNGVAVDITRLCEMSWTMSKKLTALETEIYNLAGQRFNINSSQQLGTVLFEKLKLLGGKRTKSGFSTNAAVLENLKGMHPIITLLLDYRQLAKLKSTYVDALPTLINPETGRIHTTFNQTGTTTGRLSSSNPNLQNIPIRTSEGREVRKAFIAEKDSYVLLSADYSQIDLRALAHLSGDPILIEAFSKDEDIHTITASQVFGVSALEVTSDMRRFAKTINFGVIYGMSEYGLEQATELSREEARLFIKSYFEKYRGVKEYLMQTKREAAEKGYVQTLLGKRRYIPEITSPNGQIRLAAERMAINMPVQGTSADIIKVAMIQVQKEIDAKGLQSQMILQVHDELVFELPQEELQIMTQLLYDVMPNAIQLMVPLKIDVKTGRNWDEMEYTRMQSKE